MAMMKIVAVVATPDVARSFSRKWLMDLAGRPLLARRLEQIQRCAVHEVVVAAGPQAPDDEVAAVAESVGVRCFRDDASNLLTRFVGAARHAAAGVIVRVGADCPLFDPQVADRVIAELMDNLSLCDYAGNVLEPTYPRGLEVEAFTFGALTWMDRMARTPEEREQVTLLARHRLRHMCLCRSVKDTQDNSDLWWTVDEPHHLEFMRRLYAEMDLANRPAGYREIIAHVRSSPELLRAATRRPIRAAA
jgi:spore coat polysaccharide biosynthesis protein SpsF